MDMQVEPDGLHRWSAQMFWVTDCTYTSTWHGCICLHQEIERGDRESDEDMAKLVADLQKRMERTEVFDLPPGHSIQSTHNIAIDYTSLTNFLVIT